MKNLKSMFFIYLLIVSVVCVNQNVTYNVLSAESDNILIEDWEDLTDIDGDTNLTGEYLTTFNYNPTLELDYGDGDDGDWSLLVGSAAFDGIFGYINLTDTWQYIHSFSIKFDPRQDLGAGGQENLYLDFYNGTDFIFSWFIRTNPAYFGVYTAGQHSLITSAFGGGHFWANFTHVTGNICNFTLNTGEYYQGSTELSYAYSTFTSITLRYDNAGGNYVKMNIDDIYLNTETSEDSGYGDISDYDYFGCVNCKQSGLHTPTVNKYVEGGFYVPITATITAFDIYVATDNGYSDSFLNNINGYINQISIGNPDYYIENPNPNYLSIIRWTGLNINLTDEKPYAELKSNGIVYHSYYWDIGCNYGDCDGDGYISRFEHNDPSRFGNGDDGMSSVGGISYCFVFYYENSPYTPTNPYDPDFGITLEDTIDFTGNGYAGKHPDFSIKSFYSHTPVGIQWSVSNLDYQNIMYIYNEGSLTGHTQDFSPRNLKTDYIGVEGFTPTQTGNHTVTIIRNSVEIANESFYVYPVTDSNYYIWTIPTISKGTNPYYVHYHYNNTNDGYIGLFYSTDNINYANAEYTHSIGSGEQTNSFQYPPNNILTTHYWCMFAKTDNNAYVRVGDIHTHLIQMSSNAETYLYGSYDTLQIKTWQPSGDKYARQSFHYAHNQLGGDIWIFINDQPFYYVGDLQISPLGGIQQNFYKTGLYKCDIRVKINDSYVKLENTTYNFVVTEDTTGTTPEIGQNIKEGIIGILTYEQKLIVGIVLIIGFVFACYYLQHELSKDSRMNIQMPAVVYIIVAICGFALDIYLGLFDAYTIVILVFVLTALVVISVSNKFNGNFFNKGE